MKIELNQDPKLTFAVIKLQDLLDEQGENPDPDFEHIISHRDIVIKTYQSIFNPDRIPSLTKAEFEGFLLFRNNHHWTDLHRVQKFMTEDMGLLREALALLLDENQLIQNRLNRLRPERYWGEHSMVSHLGMPVLTAILMVVYPDRYGVWNNTSDAGMKIVRLWDRRWEKETAGNSYAEMNIIFKYISKSIGIDLWSLDALWWVLKKKTMSLTGIVKGTN